MLAGFWNIGVVSETSLFILLATLSSIHAIRNASWSVSGSTLWFDEARKAWNLCFYLLTVPRFASKLSLYGLSAMTGLAPVCP